jgi:tRNA modification GTPase
LVSVLTAEGRGAIAVVRVWGPEAIKVADTVFRPHRGTGLAETPRGRLRLGHIGQGVEDEVVVAVLKEDEPTVEVQCHGGTAAVALVVAALEQAGAHRADASQLVGHVSRDPLTAVALVDLARAPTLLTAEILLDQAHGALRRELARVARSIDHQPDRALIALQTLIDRAEVGLRLVDGWRVVIVGRPNVGKSRLFNALAGFARAIVDPAPGTTRDVVSQKLSLRGWPVELADTAGLREALDPIESIGIERSRRELREADLTVLVLDRSLPLQPIDRELIATNPGAIVVGNKSDVPPAWHECDDALDSRPIVTVSAQKGDSLTRLVDAITRRIVPRPPPNGAAVPFRRDQLDQLSLICGSLLAGDRAAAASRLASMMDEPSRPESK